MSAPPPDPDGLRYLRHWEPVLAAPSHRLLERVAALSALAVADPAATLSLLDLGAGTGSLTLAAAERWPGARIISLDASRAMLSVARHRVAQRWHDGRPGAFEWLTADAAAVPLADASVDIVVSSFMLQLAPDRQAVLAEVRRLMRPGGILGFVTWLVDGQSLAPDVEFDEAVYDLGLEDPDPTRHQPDPGDYESAAEAREELQAVGFADVDVRAGQLAYSWSREAYRHFKEDYDERDLLESLSPADRDRLLRRLDERWAHLPAGAFELRAPIVWATARRPALR